MNSKKTTGPRIAKLRKFLIFSVWGLLALVLCIGAVVWHSHAEKRRAWAQIQKRLDAIRAGGEPVSADDLAKLYPDPPPERDAALLLAPAVAALREPVFPQKLPFVGSGRLPRGTEALTLQMRTNIEAVLNANQTALNAIPWNKITNAWFGSGLALGLTNWPRSSYRTDRALMLGKILCLQAVVEAESGNGSKASESLCHSLALFRLFRSEILSYHNNRRLGENLCCQTLERVINRAEIPADDLADLERLLSDDHPDGLREALLVQRCLGIDFMTKLHVNPNTLFESYFPSETKLDSVKREIVVSGMRLTGKMYTDADFTDMLDLRAAQIAVLKLPLKERFAEINRINNQAATHRGQTYARRFVGIPYDVADLCRSDVETIAKMQVTRTALEIERWRLAHGGRAPDSLADLAPVFAPSIPLDPFDGNPLRYKKLPRGFLIYSIGADFTDDGGKEKPAGDDVTEHYDITFSVER